MDNHFDVEKLFSEKLQNFEQETTAEFDQTMERKIDRLQWQRWIKWIIGGIFVVGLTVVIPLNIDSTEKEETYSSIDSKDQHEYTERSRSVRHGELEEKHLLNEKEIEDIELFPSTPLREGEDVDLENSDNKEYTERSRSVRHEESEEKHQLNQKETKDAEMFPSTPLREGEDVDLENSDNKEYTERRRSVGDGESKEKHLHSEKGNEDVEMFPSTPLRERKDIDMEISDNKEYTSTPLSVQETNASNISPEHIPKHLIIKPLFLNNKAIELEEKPKLYPTSFIDEKYIAKEKAKAQKQQQKEEKQALQEQQELEKEKLKAKQVEDKKQKEEQAKAEKLALKKQKEVEKENQKAKKTEIQQQKKELKEQKKNTRKFKNNKSNDALEPSKKENKKKKYKIKKNRVPGAFEGAIEISAAPLFVKNLSPPLEPKNDTVTNWLTNEEFKTSYDFGVEFMLKQKESDWLVKTGLRYQKFSEEVNYYFLREYIDQAQSHWDLDSIFEYHIDPPNFDTVLTDVDSSWYEHWETSETSQKYTNQYQYLNIPILLGYHIDMRKQTKDPDYKKGFDFHVLAGTGIGILLQSKGYHYDTDGHIYSYPSSQETTIDWYLHAQLAMNYHWKNISLFAKPKLQFQTRNRSFDEYYENRHYLIYGVDFGVRIKIFQ